MKERIKQLKCDLKQMKAENMRKRSREKDRELEMSKHLVHPIHRINVDPDRVAAFAYALLEGADASDIACQMLNEIDFADHIGVLDGDGSRGGDMYTTDRAKFSELEGVVEVTLNRVALLEGQLRDIRRVTGAGQMPA